MNVEVETAQGVVRGVGGHGAVSFKGIPFAAAPVGDLRFAPPAGLQPRDGVLDAAEYGAISLQHVDPLSVMIPGCEWNFYHPGAVQGEDCLNLNIWVPDGSSDAPRAVYVWIHGGAFLAGSGTGLWCDGANLAVQEDIIVVTVNYRLGALGALSVDLDASAGNNFLRDQIAALTWIRDNIGAFGGDAAKVTIGGESAGAMSVVALMSVPGARGLFRAAIVQSGHGSFVATSDDALSVAKQYLADLDPESTSVAALRSADVQTLLDAQERLVTEVVVPFRPVVDGTFLPAKPLTMFQDNAQALVPLLIGTNTNENNLLAAMGWGSNAAGEDLSTFITNLLDDADPAVIEELVDLYRSTEADEGAAWKTVTNDRDWRSPVRDLCDAHADGGSPVFAYQFTYRTPVLDGALQACHALDVPFPFGNLAKPGVAEFVGDDEALQQVREAAQLTFVRAWGAFIRTGQPVHDDVPSWPAYRSDERNVMRIGIEPGLRVDPYGPRLERWKGLNLRAALLEL